MDEQSKSWGRVEREKWEGTEELRKEKEQRVGKERDRVEGEKSGLNVRVRCSILSSVSYSRTCDTSMRGGTSKNCGSVEIAHLRELAEWRLALDLVDAFRSIALRHSLSRKQGVGE